MKEFFEQCLRDLHRLTGLKQYLEICNKPTEAEAKEEMDTIVAGMVRVSEKFNYISQDAQKRIVAHQILSDPDLYALNAKVVYKWFNAVSDKYWHESGHLETNAMREQEKEIKPPSEETLKLIETFKAKLIGSPIQAVPQVSVEEIEEIKEEDKERQEGKISVSKGFKPRTYRKEYIKLLEHQGLTEWASWHKQKPETDLVFAFKIENEHIVAKDETEAREIYLKFKI